MKLASILKRAMWQETEGGLWTPSIKEFRSSAQSPTGIWGHRTELEAENSERLTDPVLCPCCSFVETETEDQERDSDTKAGER